MGGGGSTTVSCAGLCTASMGEWIKEADRTYRRGSANLMFDKQSISQTTINLSHPRGMISWRNFSASSIAGGREINEGELDAL